MLEMLPTPLLASKASTRTISNDARGPTTIHLSPTDLLSKGEWIDETRDFNMKDVLATLRNSNEQPSELVRNYNWYPDAVPVGALLPPGVPLSAKEINAYYPHHVRWKDVMLRLTHNDYRGPDILGIQVSSKLSAGD